MPTDCSKVTSFCIEEQTQLHAGYSHEPSHLEELSLWYGVPVSLRVFQLQGVRWVVQPYKPQVLGKARASE